MAIPTLKPRCESLRSPSAVCRMNQALTLPSAPFSGGKAAGLNQQLRLARAGVALLQRRFSDAVPFAEEVTDDSAAQHSEYGDQKYVLIGAAKKALHDEPGAREAFLKAKDLVQRELSQSPNEGK